jgi:hypothetical protein
MNIGDRMIGWATIKDVKYYTIFEGKNWFDFNIDDGGHIYRMAPKSGRLLLIPDIDLAMDVRRSVRFYLYCFEELDLTGSASGH